jgi:cytoskeletal protein CcmA (bactofilin family)
MNLRRLATTTVLGLTLLAAALPLSGFLADFVTTNIFIVAEGEIEAEDTYVASSSARIDGVIDGDLVISTSALRISGTVTGDVLVMTQGTVHITGEVGGSVRGAAREVIIEGSVAHDVAVAAVATRLSGTVGRDALVFGGSLKIDGQVKGNVNGRLINATVDGKVGRDVDIAVGNLTLGPAAVVDGDVVYRSGSDADTSATAEVGGQFDRLPTRGSFGVELVLTLATILGFLAFLFAGVVLLWLFRATAPRAVGVIGERPLRAAAVGVAALIVLPVLALVMTITLVGAPVAIAVILLLVLALLFAPVPAVTALGSRLLRRLQWGLFASFVFGAVIWRLGIWLIPLVGFVLYLGALATGLGGWLIAIWEQRRETMPADDLLPRQKAVIGAGAIPSPIDWDAPLAPGTRGETDEGETSAEPEQTE